LKFLGDTDESLIQNIQSALNEIAAQFEPFNLTLRSVGAFPRLASPRVLWVGIERNEALLDLQKKIESALKPLGFLPEKRAFSGHLTLARLKGDHWHENLRRFFLECGDIIDGMKLPVNKVILFKSDLQPGGAIYTPLHTVKLG